MEKIIYNNKLKKILIVLLVIIILSELLFPKIVLARRRTDNEMRELEEEIISIGKKITEIMSVNGTGNDMFIPEESWTKFVRVFYELNPNNNIEVNDEKINITVVYLQDLKDALSNVGGLESVDRITYPAGGYYEDFISVEEIPDPDHEEPEEGEEDTRTDKQKIMAWVKENRSIKDDDTLESIAEYAAEFDGNGNITRIKNNIINGEPYVKKDEETGNITYVYVDPQYLQEIGVDDTTISVVEDEQDPDDSLADEVGGILLKPIFALVNFVADAIMRMLDGLMIDQDFWGQNIMGGRASDSPSWSGNADFTGKLDTLLGAKYPSIRYTPERIFSGDVELLSIDFISNAMNGGPLETVRTTVASWYKALRLFAIIGLLSVLIYTGIKVMLSANAKDKAKYKEWILNWFLAVAILFSMHYIMSFVITVTDEISELLNQSIGEIKAQVTVDGSVKYFTTNLMGICRFMVQSKEASVQIGYEVMYIALIVYTFKFTFVYLKRVLNMAFLTLIAPLIALMYPIDKMTDGSAQGFDMWLKEYIYNALLQPMHLLLYYILVGSAVSLAADNPIYGIVVLMFMTEAEKLLKKIFGFDKAHGGTVGGMGNAFAAGALASQAGNLMKQLGRGNSKGGNGDRGDNKLPEGPPRKKDVDNVDDFADDSTDTSSEEEDHESDSNGSLNSAAGAYQNSEDPIADAKRERLEEMLADGQIDESELTDEQKELLGKKEPDPEEPEDPEKPENPEKPKNPESSPPPPKPSKKSTDNSIPKNRFAQGAKAVGKRLAKPIWDFDKSGKYNGKRLRRKIVKGAVGLGVGTAAAAVQAGISITDGKYNAFEGIASFGAGFAGGSAVTGGVIDAGKSLIGTFEQGYHSADDPEQKAEWEDKQRARYHEDWSNRDDVNKIFKEKFGEDNFKDMKERAKVYTDRGYNDPKEVAKLMSTSNEFGWNDKETISHMNFKKQLQEEQSYKAVTDLDERGKYIDAYIQNKKLSGSKAERVRKQFDEKFKAVAQLDEKMRS